MMKRISLLLISLIILLTAQASHGESSITTSLDEQISLENVNIHALIDADGTTHFIIDATVNNTSSESINYVQYRIDSLRVNVISVKVDSEVATAEVISIERYTELRIGLVSPLARYNTSNIHLELTTYDLQSGPILSPDGNHYQSDFIFYIRPLSLLRNVTVFVHLPAHSSLSQSSVVPLFPVPYGNLTDGHSMIFYWRVDIIQSGQERVFIVKYQTLLTTVPSITGIGMMELIVAGLVGLIAGAVTMHVGPRLWYRIRRIGVVRLVGVTNEENEILDTIRKRGGSCPQKDLYRELDMSQAKVSMILSNLEERGLIRRFRDGRENMVHIIESNGS